MTVTSAARIGWHPRTIAGAIAVAALAVGVARFGGWSALGCWALAGVAAGFAASGST